jgi:MFS family permease
MNDRRNMALIVGAASLGTAFEWYDFFLFGTLAAIIARNFTAGSESAGFLFTLGAFAAGFFVRPFGALFFGHLGDKFGRKRAFIQTISLMGVATVALGVLPAVRQVGLLSPVLLVLVRVLQGFAIGGEYGGAAVYVAEHADPARRGYLTSWLQSTAALGLVLALAVVLVTRTVLGERAFQDWGWRVPFLASALLLALSIQIRRRLAESPVFLRMRESAMTAGSPLREAFDRRNLPQLVIALVCILLAQGAVWYTAHFYAQFFMERVLKMSPGTVDLLMVSCVVLTTGCYVFFGWLSDRIGRKPVMIFGMIVAAASYWPAFHALTTFGNPTLEAAARRAPVAILADPEDCHFQFDLLGRRALRNSCDIARRVVADAGIPYTTGLLSAGSRAVVRVGELRLESPAISLDGGPADSAAAVGSERREFTGRVNNALLAAGYPQSAPDSEVNRWGILLVLVLLMVGATALYGPQAAALVEMFPTRIRYTALAVSYNVGTGWVGGLLPVSAFALVAATGNIYFGLAYPISFTLVSLVTAIVFLRETRGRALNADDLPAVSAGAQVDFNCIESGDR